MYLQYIYGVFECTYSIFMVYFNAFIVCFNVFHYISMSLNVFVDIVINISPSHSHCNAFAMYTHLHNFFNSIQWLPSQHAIPLHFFFFHSHWPVHTIYEKITYQSLLFTSIHHPTFQVPHSTFHVVIGCAEHNGVQVIFYISYFQIYTIYKIAKFNIKHITNLDMNICYY
jgi:hypothetical protein